jgi:DNA recombination protein RmuC
MMQCANTLVERVQLFAERFTKVGELLDKTRKSFDELNTVTATSGQSITTAARNLLKYGAQENKKKKSLCSTSFLEEKEEENNPALSSEE